MGARLFLGLIFFSSGVGKLIPFPGIIGPVWLEEALAPYELGLYARFVAWSEAGIGLLLFSRRFAVAGAVMLVPLIVNIFVVTVSMSWQGTPYVVAFFGVLNAWILYCDRHRLLGLVSDLDPSLSKPFGSWSDDLPACAGIVLTLLGVPIYGASPIVGYAVIVLGLTALAVTPMFRRRMAQRRAG